MQTMFSTAGAALSANLLAQGDDTLAPGMKAGPWVIERELGRGGMGAVYACVHEEIGKRAALKVMHRRLLTPAFNVERVLLEAKVVNAIGHPNIVDIFETGTLGDGRPYIVMERLEGQPLSYRADEGKMLATEVIAVLMQLCDALMAAHAANVVHRDLKLDNVFLLASEDGTAPRAKILDWGIAKVIDHDVKHTVEGQLVGTPQYLSPEQAKGARVTSKSDVYSLGVMAYEMFLEQLPFEAETAAEIMAMHLRSIPPPPSDMWPDIPPELEQLLLVMLAKAPENRPSMKEVAQTLQSVHATLEARRGATSERIIPLRRASSQMAPIRLPSAPVVHDSQEAFSPTMPADSMFWRARRNRRVQFAVGGFAIAVATLMFVLTRGGDSNVAIAATGSLMGAPTGSVEVATPTERLTTHETAPSAQTPPNLAPQLMAKPAQHLVKIEAPKVATDKPVKVVPSNSIKRPSSRTQPNAPRRTATRLDPNGVMDAY
ncbi:MAG TPA: protein kinase [Kofleriaceae bacterium]|jgi:serine/threonine-protein kinase